MRFLVDACTGPAVARWLESQGHEVYSVYDEAPSSSDDDLLDKAHSENWILITNDKDFGAMIFRARKPHRGVVLLRLKDERVFSKISALSRLLGRFADQIANGFVVVSETNIRFAQKS
jgi:predicted nuclease of predicted toxin-antitoxin system